MSLVGGFSCAGYLVAVPQSGNEFPKVTEMIQAGINSNHSLVSQFQLTRSAPTKQTNKKHPLQQLRENNSFHQVQGGANRQKKAWKRR
jgi:hypothetical protein